MKLIFLHGLPGVGKLTVGKELQKLTGYQLFHNHLTVDLVSALFPFGSRPFIEFREKIWLDAFEAAYRAKTKGLIFTFAFEKTVSKKFIPQVLELAESHKGKVYFVELTAATQEIKKRLGNKSRKQFGKIVSILQFEDLLKSGRLYRGKNLQHNFVIDNTKLNPRQAAAKIEELSKLK